MGGSLLFAADTFAGGLASPPNVPPNAGPPNNCSPPNSCPSIPVDGGIFLLIAAGVAYGSKKIYDAHKGRN